MILVLYLDDIVVFAPIPQELVERLNIVLGRHETAGLKLKLSKCDLLKKFS